MSVALATTETRVELATTETDVDLVVSQSDVVLETSGPTLNVSVTNSLSDLGYTNVKDSAYGALGNDSIDDSLAFASAVLALIDDSSTTALYAAYTGSAEGGGDLYLPPGIYPIGTGIELTRFQNIIGAGKDRVVIKPTLASMTPVRVSRHSQNTVVTNDYKNNRRSHIQGFTIDGGSLASTTGLALGRGSQWVLQDINVINCTTGILMEETQNVTCIDVSAQSNGTNLVLDRGCGGLHFSNCEFSGALTGYNLHIKGTTGYDSATATASDTPCQQIVFDNVRFEMEGGASTLGMAYIDAGKHVDFRQCVFAEGGASHAMDFVTVAKGTGMATQHIKFTNCSWLGTAACTAVKTIGAADVTFLGKNVVQVFGTGINRSNSGSTFGAYNITFSAVTTEFSNVGTNFTDSTQEGRLLGTRFSHAVWPSGQTSGLMGGSGSPETVYSALNGALYIDTVGTDTVSIPRLYVKATDNTGTRAQNGWIRVRAGQDFLAKTTDYTVTQADVGLSFTTTGAGGAVIFTLPAVAAAAGYWYRFVNTVDQTMTVTAPAGTLVAFNNAAATSIAFSTASEKIGCGVEVFCDGAKWVAMPILGSETATPTIT